MVMAVATQDYERYDLKSCPEGYVMLKRMTYGQKLYRQQMAMKMVMQGNEKSKDFSGEMAFVNAAATEYEFSCCIGDHNLEDEQGKPLDLKKSKDIQRLDPRIGEEIQTKLGELNNFEEEEEGN